MTTATKTERTTRQRRTLDQISHQVEIALTSEDTPEDVKECLKTIIFEASNEASMPLGDFSLVRAALPNIIEALDDGYGEGVLHSINGIIQYNTNALQKFIDDKLDQDLEDLSELLSQVMKHPKLPTRLYNVMTDELSWVEINIHTPENVLANLQKMEAGNEHAK